MTESANTWQAWVARQMARHGWTTQADVVRSSNLTKSAISQWLDTSKHQQPNVANCRRAAEAFGVPILSALVAAGYLTEEEAGHVPPDEPNTMGMTTDELLIETRHRVAEYEAKIKRLEQALHRPAESGRYELDVPGVTTRHAGSDGHSAVR